MRLDEGLTGWVARHQTPEFIRDNAMADARMKFFPVLEEERFQSMVAVPIISRAGESIGVIVLHTEAPREFTEDTLKLLVHIASLVSGAIENAQLYDQQRRRVDALTSLSGLAQEVATAGDAGEIGRAVTGGMRRLLGAAGLPALPPRSGRERADAALLVARTRPPSPRRCRPPSCCWPRSRAGPRGRRPARCGPTSTCPTCWSRRWSRAASGSGSCAPARRRGVRSPARTPRWPARSPTWPRSRSSAPS